MDSFPSSFIKNQAYRAMGAIVYVYMMIEPRLYTVGFYAPNGCWHSDSDWRDKEDAAKRVHWLNGGRQVARRFEKQDLQNKV